MEKYSVNIDRLFILVYGIDCESSEVFPKDVEVQSSALLAFMESGEEPNDLNNNIHFVMISQVCENCIKIKNNSIEQFLSFLSLTGENINAKDRNHPRRWKSVVNSVFDQTLK